MVIKSLPDGSILRLKDVAKVELGIQNYTVQNSTNGHAGANCMIAQTPGSNANEIIKLIDETAIEIRKELPPGMELVDVMSTKDFLDASIHNVVRTLLEAIFLVVLVVYVFLQDLKSTFIPSLAIIVSLIGTFAVLYFIGFSLNLLTLFALVLVIGTVVDDAIVVVEAVQAKFDEGYKSPYLATVDAMEGITSALVTTTVVFMSVFIPVCFVGGTTGVFYTQFGVTMAIAVVISTINAMTLSPALCALMLRPRKDGDTSFSARFHDAFNVGFHRVVCKYQRGVLRIFRHRWLPWASIVVVCVLLGYMLKTTKTGFVPNEDMGSINVNVQCAPGTSMAVTGEITREVERRIKDIPQFRLYNMTIGRGSTFDQSSSAGSFNIRLKNWDERKGKGDDINSVIDEIYRRTADITQAQIRVSTRPMISGYGATSGFELHVQDRKGGKIEDLMRVTRELIDSLNREPAISRAFTTFDTKYPQYRVEVDAARCKRDGVTPNAVLKVLSGYVGGSYSSNLTRFTKLYRVIVQASPEFRLDENALSNMRVRSESGQMIPITQYITMERVYGSEGLNRFNLFSSISVMGQTANGYSSGQALEAIRRTADSVLPEGYGYEFGGMSREEASLGNTTAIVFAICVVFIYLVLCALYESLFIPLAVIMSVPFGLLGSFLFSRMWGLENNIYMQTGLIMLIGLLAKTAILLTEYATERHRKGMSITMAAMTAAKVRLRPILMTSLTMIFGMLPLVFAHGVGANGNISLGVCCAGGMLVGTIALLFIVPVLYMPFQWLHSRFGHAVKG
jgi:HAE1 family hydrophobic/amphiphilic exporter-1